MAKSTTKKSPTRARSGKTTSSQKSSSGRAKQLRRKTPRLVIKTGQAAREARQEEAQRAMTLWGVIIRLLPVWALLAMLLILEPTLPFRAIGGMARAVAGVFSREDAPQGQAAEPVFVVEGAESAPLPDQLPQPTWDLEIASAFRPEIAYWADEIAEWSLAYRIKPNLIATLMQIESCGDPNALSPVGATGLFQVMPFHFADDEDPFDPATNARRGLTYFAEVYTQANGDLGLAFAAYNAGPGILNDSPSTWPNETKSYQFWGSGIYEEVELGLRESPTLQDWLDSGGIGLCNQAATTLKQMEGGIVP